MNSSRDENEGTYCCSGEGGGGRSVTPDMRCYWKGGQEWCEDNEWDGEEKNIYIYI